MNDTTELLDPLTALQWLAESGVDEAIGEEPINRLQEEPPAAPPPIEESRSTSPARPAPFAAPVTPPSEALEKARQLADSCTSLEALKEAVETFDGLAIRKMATNTVFADGVPSANVMIIGEAPGAQEDRQGIPFCGPSGQLLDRMFATIGLSRQENLYISNTLFWRPPGNRNPSPEELAICGPLVEKHIALVAPKLLILAGGVAVRSLLKQEASIGRMRGKLHEYRNPYMQNPVPVVIMYHPSYLLRSPAQKRLAWEDLLLTRQMLVDNNLN